MKTAKKTVSKKTSEPKHLSGKELDAKFDAGEEDILNHFDTEYAILCGLESVLSVMRAR